MTIGASFAARLLAICVVVSLVLAGTAMGEVSREGLVGEWQFDGDAKDSSGNGNDGMIYGATFVDGKFGKALSFDGVDDYAETQNSPSLNVVGSISVEAWVKPNFGSQNRNFAALAKMAPLGGGPNSKFALEFDFGTSATPVYFWIYNGDWVGAPSTTVLQDNVWYHVVGIYDGSFVRIYVNGMQEGSPKIQGNPLYSTETLQFGSSQKEKRWGKWLLDEVRIYNRALSAEEIKANYEAGQPASTITKTASPTPTPAATPPEPTSSAVLLHGEKTDVVLGEDVLLKLSAVNLITKPPMTVQVILYPPSGMSVTSSEFVKSGAGIYTTTYSLNRGEGRDIEVRIKTNQVGDFNVKGRIVYYFGDNQSTAEDHTLNLPIKVRKESELAQNEETPAQKTPGFGIIISISVVLFLFLKRGE